MRGAAPVMLRAALQLIDQFR